jgi:alanine racemase
LTFGEETGDGGDATFTVDLDALAANYATLKAQSPAEVAPVVKADAYGLGADAVAKRLWAEGARSFFVARLAEGERLRRHLGPDRPATVYVLDGCPAGAAPRLMAAQLTPVLNSAEQIDAWRVCGGRPTALMLDTGLHRLGLTAEAAQAAAAFAPEVEVVMSHLACADRPAHPMNRRQRERFLDLAVGFPSARRSLAASDGLFLGPDFAFDMVRTGICLYGGGPEGRPDPRIEPVVTFAAPILQIRDLQPGDTVGYGAAFTTERPMRVAVVAAGYADGVLRAAFPRAYGSFAGRPSPVVGRISMDLTLFDVTGHPEARPGATIEIVGPDASIDLLAQAAGSIAYELLTRLGARTPRTYLGHRDWGRS